MFSGLQTFIHESVHNLEHAWSSQELGNCKSFCSAWLLFECGAVTPVWGTIAWQIANSCVVLDIYLNSEPSLQSEVNCVFRLNDTGIVLQLELVDGMSAIFTFKVFVDDMSSMFNPSIVHCAPFFPKWRSSESQWIWCFLWISENLLRSKECFRRLKLISFDASYKSRDEFWMEFNVVEPMYFLLSWVMMRSRFCAQVMV